ncbi:MAG TPA: DUF58 domain-containing protein [Candidatus Altiarchaeales archaeon]|nr:DUF58 domain-containing protein [Candidatus Altiarchaeales archaeon]HEX55221.1 DUF58 domain-containing protein [Candidatus Altiarchaeales archaeon]
MEKKLEEVGTRYIDKLVEEIDANVREIIDTFRLILKYQILFRGSGIEFAGLREYVPEQDDATKIDWKASLRAKKLYVKQFEDERDLDVYILLDVSNSMLLGTQEKLKSEYAAVVAGTLAYAAVESGDNVGFAMFNDDIIIALDPVGDISQYYKILRLIVDPRNYGGNCDLGKSLSYLINMVADRTILFIISDFIGIGDGWEDALKMIGGKLDRVLGIMIRDIRDTFMPPGMGCMRFSDPFSDNVLSVNTDKIREKFEKLAKEQETKVESEFRNSGLGFVKIYTTKPFVKPLISQLELTEI